MGIENETLWRPSEDPSKKLVSDKAYGKRCTWQSVYKKAQMGSDRKCLSQWHWQALVGTDASLAGTPQLVLQVTQGTRSQHVCTSVERNQFHSHCLLLDIYRIYRKTWLTWRSTRIWYDYFAYTWMQEWISAPSWSSPMVALMRRQLIRKMMKQTFVVSNISGKPAKCYFPGGQPLLAEDPSGTGD